MAQGLFGLRLNRRRKIHSELPVGTYLGSLLGLLQQGSRRLGRFAF